METIYMSSYPQGDIAYRASFPITTAGKARYWLGRILIRMGRRIIDFNGTITTTTGTSNNYRFEG